MAPIMRQITADFSAFAGLADAETPSAVSVTFTLNQTIGADGDLVLRGEYTFATDDAGVLDVWLVVPDDAGAGAPYTCYLPSNEEFSFVLAAGAPIDLLELWVLASVPTATLADALLATYTPLATFEAHEDLVGDAALGHVKNGGNVTINIDGTMTAAGGGAPSGPAGGVLSGTYPDPGFASDMATQAELDAEATTRASADAALQTDINTRALASALAAYAQLAVAQTFTKAQTVQGEAANEATGIFYVKDSAGNTIMAVRKSVGVNDGRLLFDAGNVSNVPWVKAQNLPSGNFEVRLFAGGGYLIVSKDGNGVLDDSTGHVRRARVNTDTYSTAGKPSHSFEDEGRAAIDTTEIHPGDTANTSKDTAIRRRTSGGNNAIAGRRNAYFYDTTHASRKGAHTLSAADSAADRTFIEGRADGTQALVGFFGGTPGAKPTITGSRGGNAALASLLTELASLGLITDSTTA